MEITNSNNNTIYNLSDLLEIIGGGTPKTTNPDYWNGSIPWLSVVDFSGNSKYVYETEKTISKEGLENSSTKILDKGQLIISARGTVGELAILGRAMAFNQSCYGLTTRSDISNEYLYYLLLHNMDKLRRNSTGAVFDTITRETFSHVYVSIPPQIEREKAVEVLSVFDEKIELNRKTNQTLEEIAQAIFKEWFIDFNYPGATGEMVDSPLGPIPKSWRVGTLSDFGDIICGKTPSKREEMFFGGEIPFVKIPDMHNSVFILETTDSLTQVGARSQEHKNIPEFSVLVSCIATVGLVSLTSQISQTNQQINAVIPKHNFFTFYVYFIAKNLKDQLRDMGSGGSATLNVNTSNFSKIECIFPSHRVLSNFDVIVKPLFENIFKNQREIKTLGALRDLLLDDLIGKERA